LIKSFKERASNAAYSSFLMSKFVLSVEVVILV